MDEVAWLLNVLTGYTFPYPPHLQVAALDEVAWLFNVRGGDIDYCPISYAYATVHRAPAGGRGGAQRRGRQKGLKVTV